MSTQKVVREKDSCSLHRYVLQKMSSVSAAERRQAVMNRNGGGLKKKKAPIPCISRSLYEVPVSSNCNKLFNLIRKLLF
jgi:hypothetical protein